MFNYLSRFLYRILLIGDESPRQNLQSDDERRDQVMSGYTVSEFEVGFEMDKL